MHRSVRVAAGTLLAAALLAACGKGTPVTSATPTPVPTAPPQVTSEYPVDVANSEPEALILANSELWFTERHASQIGTLNEQAQVSSTPTPSKHAEPVGIASGPNGLVWFAESGIARIGQITLSTDGFTEFQLGNPKATPMMITLGSDGNMWATDPGTDSLWRIGQTGIVKQFPVRAGSKPLGITNGPDGALWFTEPGANKIGRLTIDGTSYSEYAVHTKNAGLALIVEGSDNGLWFTEQRAVKLGRMQVSGQNTNEFPLAPARSAYGLIQGSDGNYYFTDPVASTIGQFVVTTQKVKTFPTKTANAQPMGMTLGPESPPKIYVTEAAANKIAQFSYF